ncbi:MAG: hypothetical protein CME06_04150 [Gemmatimonadetes bacterium]|nr:hypothetical protein [Gemmatimonadota bacterium]
MSALGWSSLAALGWSVAGYPLAVWVAAATRKKGEYRHQSPSPSLTLIVAAANEAECLEEKLRASLALRSPGPLEIICAVNGSTDGTGAVARKVAALEPRIDVIETPVLGKTGAQNVAARRAEGEILVFTDANTDLDPGALESLLRELDDPRVDVVQGVLTIEAGNRSAGRHRPEALYWRYESWIRRKEGRLGRAFAATGALMAVRRSRWHAIAPHLMEDIVLPLRAITEGRRSVVAESAFAREPLRAEDPARSHERISLQDSAAVLSTLWRHGWANPLLAFQLISRKLLRWLGLPLYGVALLDLTFSGAPPALLLALWLPPALALCGPRVGNAGSAARHAFRMHWWALAGLVAALRGRKLPGWRTRAVD